MPPAPQPARMEIHVVEDHPLYRTALLDPPPVRYRIAQPSLPDRERQVLALLAAHLLPPQEPLEAQAYPPNVRAVW